MDLYARHPDTDALRLVDTGFASPEDAHEHMDQMQRFCTWPIAESNIMFLAVLKCSTGWHWLCSDSMAERWIPGEGTRADIRAWVDRVPVAA